MVLSGLASNASFQPPGSVQSQLPVPANGVTRAHQIDLSVKALIGQGVYSVFPSVAQTQRVRTKVWTEDAHGDFFRAWKKSYPRSTSEIRLFSPGGRTVLFLLSHFYSGQSPLCGCYFCARPGLPPFPPRFLARVVKG